MIVTRRFSILGGLVLIGRDVDRGMRNEGQQHETGIWASTAKSANAAFHSSIPNVADDDRSLSLRLSSLQLVLV